jgi:hypothetical protein
LSAGATECFYTYPVEVRNLEDSGEGAAIWVDVGAAGRLGGDLGLAPAFLVFLAFLSFLRLGGSERGRKGRKVGRSSALGSLASAGAMLTVTYRGRGAVSLALVNGAPASVEGVHLGGGGDGGGGRRDLGVLGGR